MCRPSRPSSLGVQGRTAMVLVMRLVDTLWRHACPPHLPPCSYNMACCWAALGQRQSALTVLEVGWRGLQASFLLLLFLRLHWCCGSACGVHSRRAAIPACTLRPSCRIPLPR